MHCCVWLWLHDWIWHDIHVYIWHTFVNQFNQTQVTINNQKLNLLVICSNSNIEMYYDVNFQVAVKKQVLEI